MPVVDADGRYVGEVTQDSIADYLSSALSRQETCADSCDSGQGELLFERDGKLRVALRRRMNLILPIAVGPARIGGRGAQRADQINRPNVRFGDATRRQLRIDPAQKLRPLLNNVRRERQPVRPGNLVISVRP